MVAKLIIACLDVKDGRVVKGTQFINLRDAGDPVELARFYDRAGADELVLLDISASPGGAGHHAGWWSVRPPQCKFPHCWRRHK